MLLLETYGRQESYPCLSSTTLWGVVFKPSLGGTVEMALAAGIAGELDPRSQVQESWLCCFLAEALDELAVIESSPWTCRCERDEIDQLRYLPGLGLALSWPTITSTLLMNN
jgi:hypothetical protein